MSYAIKEYSVDSTKITLANSKEVMAPSPYSVFLSQYLTANNYEKVLDIGTGNGFLGILLAKLGAKEVIVTDINEQSQELVDLNSQLNNTQNQISFRYGSFFEPVNELEFDMIVCNPSQLPMSAKPRGYKDSFYFAGKDGRLFLDALISQAPKYLRQKGNLFFVNSSLSDLEKTKDLLSKNNFEYKIIGEKELQLRSVYFKHLPWFKVLEREGKCKMVIKEQKIYERLFAIHATLNKF